MAKLKMISVDGGIYSITNTKTGVTLSVVPPLRAGAAWTDEERERLVWRRAKGVSLDDLATLHERTKTAIRSELKHIHDREQAGQRAQEVHAVLG